MRFQNFINESFDPSKFKSERDLTEHFISKFNIESLIYEAVIFVSNEVEKIVHEIENSKEWTIKALNNILTKYNIAFVENKSDLSGYNYKFKNLFFICIEYNKQYLEELISKGSFINWHMIARRIGWIIGHEMIHNDQNYPIKDDNIIKRISSFGLDLNKKEEKNKYLSNIHEIMAFAYSIWKELEYEIPSKDKLLQLLKRPQNLSQFSDIAKDYFETFDYNFESKVLKRLLKYLHEYIESMRN